MIKAILLAALVPCMTQHRNMTPSMEVSTNLYGSVTGIVDKTYVTNAIGANVFQEKLVSGTNIKTINDQSLLGSGNIVIQGGGGGGGISDRITNSTDTIMADGRWITKNGATFATNNLCTVTAAQEKANIAQANAINYTKANYIPWTGLGGDALMLYRSDDALHCKMNNLHFTLGYISEDIAPRGYMFRTYYNEMEEFGSRLVPDDSPVATSNMVEAIVSQRKIKPDRIANATNTIMADGKWITKNGSTFVTNTLCTVESGTNLFVTKTGVSEVSSSGSAKEVMYIENDALTLRSCPHGTVTNQYDMLTIADDSIEIYKKSGNASNESLKIKVNGETHVQKVDGTTVTSATFKYPNVTGNRTLTIATVEDDIASKADQSDVDTLNASVTAIAGHLNAEDARFVSTNYDYSSSIPEAYVEINMTQNNTSSWVTIWKEMTRWNDWTGSNWNWSVWSGFNEWKTSTENGLQEKANKNWGMYDSEKGTLSPDGYTQISSSNILLCSGMSYERTVTTDGAIWVLRCNNGTMHINGDTNGYFKIVDGDGNSQFEIVKGDRIELGADATGVRVDTTTSPQTLVVEYTIEGATEQPTIQVCDDLSTANWKPDTDPTCLATVTWTYGQGTWTARVQRKTAGDALFVKATYLGGSISYIDHKAPAKFDSIILNGVRYYLGTAVIDNNTVLTLSTTPPNN